MQVERFGHAAIRVRDLTVAESFYGSVLGFSVAHRYPDDDEVMFRVGREDQLLVQAVGRNAPKADPSLPGLHHIAFVVAGGEAGLGRMRERLAQHDVEHRLLDHGDHRSVYFHDPDGNQVELYHAPDGARQMSGTPLQRARAFVYANARRVDRAMFETMFESRDGNELVAALLAYRNSDGGFGHALEPDLRTPSSQPLHTETALWTLKRAGLRRPDIADAVLRLPCARRARGLCVACFYFRRARLPGRGTLAGGLRRGAIPRSRVRHRCIVGVARSDAPVVRRSACRMHKVRPIRRYRRGAPPSVRVRSCRGSARGRGAGSRARSVANDARSRGFLRDGDSGGALRTHATALRADAGFRRPEPGSTTN